MEFKSVPEHKQVPLVATRLHSRAMAWWQQFKLTRTRMGKSKLISWEKMKKHLCSEFLPYNFQRMMYQKLQNLRQGTQTVDEYTLEFYQLCARNDLNESEEQLIARYICGLRVQIQDSVNLFDHVSVSAAHQRALNVEKQLAPVLGLEIMLVGLDLAKLEFLVLWPFQRMLVAIVVVKYLNWVEILLNVLDAVRLVIDNLSALKL